MQKEEFRYGSFVFDKARKTWSFLYEEGKEVGIISASTMVEVNGKDLFLKDADSVTFKEENIIEDELGKRLPFLAEFKFKNTNLLLSLHFEIFTKGNGLFISSNFRNFSNKSLILGKCSLIAIENQKNGRIYLGPDVKEETFFVLCGTQSQNFIKKISSNGGEHTSKTIGHIYNPKSKVSLNTSFLTFTHANTEHKLKYSLPVGIESYRAFCDFDGYRLPPGKSIKSEKVFVELSCNPHKTLEKWASLVNLVYKPKIRETMSVGYAGRSWTNWAGPFIIEPYENIILRSLQALKRRLAGFKIEHLWISLSNLEGLTPGKWLKFNKELFPHGIQWILEKIKEKGIKPGFWFAFFWMSQAAKEEVEENKDNLLKTKDGSPLLYGRRWTYGESHRLPEEKRPDFYILDGSHPKTHAYLKKVLEYYRKMGIRYYMFDFLNAGSGSTPGTVLYDEYFGKSKGMIKGPQVYRAALKVAREAAGEDTYILSSSGPTLQNVGLVDAARIANDYCEGRPLYPGTYFYPATYVIGGADFWTSHRHALQNMATVYFTHNRLYHNSSNLMTVDKPVPKNEAEITATIFGINGGPVMLGDDIDKIHEERLSLIKKCLPRTNEIATPLDLFTSIYPDYPKVFHLSVQTKWDRWHLLAIFNLNKKPLEISLSAKEMELKVNEQYHCYDFWNEEYSGIFKEKAKFFVPPTSVKLYRLSQVKKHPWLLSTDMHIQQGKVEIFSLSWDENTLTLKGEAKRPKGERGSILIIAPKGYYVKKPDTRDLWIAKHAGEESLIIRKEITFNQPEICWELQFGQIGDSGEHLEKEQF